MSRLISRNEFIGYLYAAFAVVAAIDVVLYAAIQLKHDFNNTKISQTHTQANNAPKPQAHLNSCTTP